MKTMFKHLTIALVLATITATPALCVETIEGTIEGASCVINNMNCAENIDDPILALERDFILVTADGEYYFMPNLRRSDKKHAFKEQVRVSGKRNGAALLVENFEVLKDNRFDCVWNYTEERKDLDGH